jgi:osmoprotectant transport system permease protein
VTRAGWVAALALAVVAASAAAAPAAAAPARVRVGSKAFTESHVLGEAAAQLARAAGTEVEHRAGLGGTRVLWEGLLRGEIDLYPEYTGTLAREILAGEGIRDDEGLRAALARRGLAMTGSLGFENTYAIGMPRALAARLGVSRLSDLARHPALRLGLTHEFMDREDGWPAVRRTYGLASAEVRGLDHDVAYRALADGRIDATDLYSTDADIRRLDLVVLEDDRDAFPEYRAVFVYRTDLAARAPAALAGIRRLEGLLSVDEMIALNARAQLDGVPAARVAAELLAAALGVEAPIEDDGLAARVLRRTAEHLALVAIALAAAVAVGIPLGVAAARSPAAGHLLLGATGVVQTIPALALLVFMIPVLGIGARPAIAALFLYGLLPIVRNTHAGLTGISPELRESADSLGLPLAARLRRIDLPLATPSILAGVRTSAVITVGTATLGALIGAGGYGQPILAGIRLASVPLTLEGAIPAALLALGLDLAFGVAERVLVPRGLRPRRRSGSTRPATSATGSSSTPTPAR